MASKNNNDSSVCDDCGSTSQEVDEANQHPFDEFGDDPVCISECEVENCNHKSCCGLTSCRCNSKYCENHLPECNGCATKICQQCALDLSQCHGFCDNFFCNPCGKRKKIHGELFCRDCGDDGRNDLVEEEHHANSSDVEELGTRLGDGDIYDNRGKW